MGEDGHTASIFADAPEWDHAITTHERFVAVHPGSRAACARELVAFRAEGSEAPAFADRGTAQDGRAERRRLFATKKCHLAVGERQAE